MIRIYSSVLLIALFISGCFSLTEFKDQEKEIAELDINYYSNKSVTSLEIPPDLTTPDAQNSFRLSELVSNVKETQMSFSDRGDIDTQRILQNPVGIEVIKNGQQRSLIIDQKPEVVWDLAKEFLKLQGFILEKENKKIGIMETNYLENRPDIPDESLGIIRSALGRALNQKYTFASIDKYRIRIEPLNDDKQTALFLTLTSLEEIVDPRVTEVERIGETTWKYKEKDQTLETEMLYRLMIFLGGEDNKNKILLAKELKSFEVKLAESINGYPKLVINLNLTDSWDQLSRAIDKANIDIVDKDILEKSFYIEDVRTSDRGVMSKLFGDEPLKKKFRISLKEITKFQTEVYFTDISEVNEIETKEYSYDLFSKLKDNFNH